MDDINAKRKKDVENSEKRERCFKYLQSLNSTLCGQPNKKVGPSKIFRENEKINRRKKPLLEQKRDQNEIKQNLRESLRAERDELLELASRTGFLHKNKVSQISRQKQHTKSGLAVGGSTASLRDQYSKNLVKDPLPLTSSDSDESSDISHPSSVNKQMHLLLKSQRNDHFLSPHKNSESIRKTSESSSVRI